MMKDLNISEIIKTRRSIRKFRELPVSDELIDQILEAGRWAPSGLNNQPWRFAIVKDKQLRLEISKLTHYSKIVQSAYILIPVFLDTEKSYHRGKDILAIGASIQNMLLVIHALGLGAVWLGEIIKSSGQISKLLNLTDKLELMAVLAVGHPAENPGAVKRKELNELVIFRK
jgi:nitroreductase